MRTFNKSILTLGVIALATLVACGSVEKASTPSEVEGSGESEDVF